MRSKTPRKPPQIGDVVTIGKSGSGKGIWQITSFETSSWNPNQRLVCLKRVANAGFKTETLASYTRKASEDTIYPADFAYIKDFLQKRVQKQIDALDSLKGALLKQGLQLP